MSAADVVAKNGHVAMLAERARESVVLECKISGLDTQVNARIMSSCVSNVRRDCVGW